jgi:hypothetical protein
MDASADISRDRSRRWRPAPALGVAMAALLLSWGSPAMAEVYRWVDENGVVHYTTDLDRIPRHLRSQVPDEGSEPETERAVEEPGQAIPGPRTGTPPWLRSIPGPRDPGRVATHGPGEVPGPLAGTPPEVQAIPAPLRAAPAKSAPALRTAPTAAPARLATGSIEGDEIWDIPGARPRPAIPEPTGTPLGADAPGASGVDPTHSELRARVMQDRETLKQLITGTEESREAWLRNPELRDIAERLRQLNADPEPDTNGD